MPSSLSRVVTSAAWAPAARALARGSTLTCVMAKQSGSGYVSTVTAGRPQQR